MSAPRQPLFPFAPPVRRQQCRATHGEIAATGAIAISPQRITERLGIDIEAPALASLDDHHATDGLPDAEEFGAGARRDGAQGDEVMLALTQCRNGGGIGGETPERRLVGTGDLLVEPGELVAAADDLFRLFAALQSKDGAAWASPAENCATIIATATRPAAAS